jgi:hypothetical protein
MPESGQWTACPSADIDEAWELGYNEPQDEP